MAARNTDVNLVIRARNEADRAINSVSGALENLFSKTDQAEGSAADLAATLALLDKAGSTIAASMDKAGAGLDRQTSSIKENKAALAALVAQQAEARLALSGINGAQVDPKFVGPRTPDAGKYAPIKAEVDRLDGAISKLTSNIQKQEASLNGAQSSLLKLQSTSAAIGDGQAAAAAKLELTNQAMREQAEAGTRLTAVQERINRLTGVNRADATGQASGAADILLRADAQYKEAEAVRATNSVLAERAQLEMALSRTTGLGRPTAREGGASFSALDEQQRKLADIAEAQQRVTQAARAEADAQQQVNSQLAERAQIESTLARTTGLGRPTARDAGASFSALDEQQRKLEAVADAEAEVTREVQALRNAMNPLNALTEEHNRKLARYRELAAAGKISTDELKRAEQQLATELKDTTDQMNRRGGSGAGAKPSLFGLKPYELTNFGYQINDVVTQLASGTSLTQTLAQQGGQIIQLFPKVGASIVSAFTNPAIIGFVGLIGAVALGIKRAADEAERLRFYTAQVGFRTDGANYDASALADQEKAFIRAGASAEQAREAVKSFLNASINPTYLVAFTEATKDAAKVMGVDMPEAAQAVVDGFTKGYDAIVALDDKLNFLTASEREHIRTLFEEGKASEARTYAFEIFARKADEVADKSRGEWASATRELGGAWSEFLDLLADTSVIQGMAEALGNLGGAARNALQDMRLSEDVAYNLEQIVEAQKKIAELQAKIDADPNGPQAGLYRGQITDRQSAIETFRRRVRESGVDPDAPAAKPVGDTKSADDTPEARRRADTIKTIDAEKELAALRDKSRDGLTSEESIRRQNLASQKAFDDEMKSSGDAIIARKRSELALEAERRDIERDNAQAADRAAAKRKQALADREREIKQFNSKVIAAEGGAAQNPHSTAVGYGQFLNGTWLEQFRKVFAAESQKLSESQILALRTNKQVASAIIDNYARENARFLEGFGAKVTAGNLYLTHFLGRGTAKAILTAPGNKPVDEIIRARDPNAGAVLSGNKGYLRTENGKGRYRTADELEKFIAGRVGGDAGNEQTAGSVAITKLLIDAKKAQDDFNLAVKQGNDDRARTIASMEAQRGLTGELLYDEQKRQAVINAEFELRQRVEQANKNLQPGMNAVEVTEQQIQLTKELAAEEFDLQNARNYTNMQMRERQRGIDVLQNEADLIRQQVEYLRSIGETQAADTLEATLESVNAKIRESTDLLIEWLETLSDAEKVDLGLTNAELGNMIETLKQAKQKTEDWGKTFGVSNKEITQALASSMSNAFTNFINKVAAGKNVFKALGQSIRELAANFVSAVAQMILQLLAYAAAVMILRALGVPIPAGGGFGGAGGGGGGGNIFGAVTSAAMGNHGGGTVGSGTGVKRHVAADWFRGAVRLHTGGIPGLSPDEVPTILQRGEEVLTGADPRHRFNGGLDPAGKAANGDVTVIMVSSPEDALEAALRRPAGEKVLIRHVQDNAGAFNAALGR